MSLEKPQYQNFSFAADDYSLHLSSHVFREASISEIFLCSCAFSLLYFIATCLTLYLIKSRNNLLSVTLLNSFNHLGTLSFISVTRSLSSARLVLNFQKEGPWLDLSMLLKGRSHQDLVVLENPVKVLV